MKKFFNVANLKSDKNASFQLLSTERDVVMGCSIVWVILFHSTINVSGYPWLNFIVGYGYLGVDIFLLLSGVSLYFSCSSIKLKNESGWVRIFYKRRLLRLIPSTLFCLTPWFLYRGFTGQKTGIMRFILDVTSLSYWIDGANPGWYVSLTIVLYLIYPLVFLLINYKNRFCNWINACVVVLICIIVNVLICFVCPEYFYKVELALGRIPIFLIGCFLAPTVKKGVRISRLMVFGCYVVFFLCVLLLSRYKAELMTYAIWRYVLGIMAFCLVIMLSTVTRFNHELFIVKIFKFLGKYTLELYLTHTQILRILTEILSSKGFSLLVINIIAIVLSLGIAIVVKEAISATVSFWKSLG